jgi:CRISPR-associated endonuclease/helicase Cas3
VVDQTTNEVETLRVNLQPAGLLVPLRQLCAIPLESSESPLAISTLRGQFADNREWSADPARPAVICGTVDMIGSRLLFSGFGVGFKGKPLHAAFLGQDVLLVHDEAHLEPAFQRLIDEIETEQRERERVKELPWRKLQVIALTATSRSDASAKNSNFALTDAEKNPQTPLPDPPTEPIHVAWRRLKAQKHVLLTSVEDDTKAPAKIAALAAVHKDVNAAVLVFARTLDALTTIAKELAKTNRKIITLTGTMRGKERDELVQKPEFKRFLKGATRGETVYLICTSAGEVGIDISADHMVCDLSTFESMAQRLGRVHRYGEPIGHIARIDVVHPASFGKLDKKTGELKTDEIDKRRSKTLELLHKLPETRTQSETGDPIYDASPKALGEVRQRSDLPCKIEDAFAPTPTILPVTDILFDSWALTTIRDKLPVRPPVEPYLHGISEGEPPETFIAWRQEVGVIEGALLDEYPPQDLLEDYPLKPHELLRDNSSRVFDRLKKLKAVAEKPETPVWMMANDDSVSVTTLGQLIDGSKDAIYYKTVLLPPSAGGLINGMFTNDSDKANDVADEWTVEGQRGRIRVWDDDPVPEGMRLVRTIDTRSDADETGDEESSAKRFWHWFELPRLADDDGSKSSNKPVLWSVHVNDVVKNMSDLTAKLSLTDDIKHALIVAAKFHDHGKRRPLFQRILGNSNPDILLAKSAKRGGRVPEQYRHEFGSLLDTLDEEEYKALKEKPNLQDLVLHLIAVHHGRGRPHFPEAEAFDPEPNGRDAAAVAAEVPRRFARLQRKYGRWGLAYLESLLRAADYAASAKPSAFVEKEQ